MCNIPITMRKYNNDEELAIINEYLLPTTLAKHIIQKYNVSQSWVQTTMKKHGLRKQKGNEFYKNYRSGYA